MMTVRSCVQIRHLPPLLLLHCLVSHAKLMIIAKRAKLVCVVEFVVNVRQMKIAKRS